ncbi:MAG: hypothetical protein WC473_01900 [Patescibacteria group bacterium]
MSKSEFIGLHGQDLYERLVVPLLGNHDDDPYTIAFIHQRFPRRFIKEYPNRIKAMIGVPRLAPRVSFLEFRQRYIDFYGEKKWNRFLGRIYRKFDKWLSALPCLQSK